MKHRTPQKQILNQPASGPVPRPWLFPLLLAAVALAGYLNSFGLGFAMDGPMLIADPRVHGFTGENLGKIFTQGYWWTNPDSGLYRPITTLSLMVNYTVLGAGDFAHGYHVVNFLLHLVNAGLLYWLALILFGSELPALLAAAIWAVHPVGVESVANVAGRADLLATMAVLGGLLIYARGRRLWWLFPIALAGVFAKESAVVLPGLMLLWDLTRGPERLREWKRSLPAYGAVLAAVAILFVARAFYPPIVVPYVDNPIAGMNFLDGRLTAVKVIGKYLLLLVWPATLSSDYSYNQVKLASLSDPAALLSLAAVVAILVLVTVRRRRDPLMFFAAGCFAIALLPVSNLAIVIGSIMAERFLYMPSIGFALAVAVLFDRLVLDPRRRRAVMVAAGIVVALLLVRTFVRVGDWKDDMTLWTANVAAAPDSFKAHKGLATILSDNGMERNLDKATAQLEIAWHIVEHVPDVEVPVNLQTDLGICYKLKGDVAGKPTTPEARAWYEKAAAVLRRPVPAGADRSYIGALPNLYRNLGNVEMLLGNHDAARAAVARWRSLEPLNPDAYISAAAVEVARGDRDAAAVALFSEIVLGISPGDTEGKLRRLYQQMPDAACAVTKTDAGSNLNRECPKVRQHLCAAYRASIRLLVGSGRSAEAQKLERESDGLGCPR